MTRSRVTELTVETRLRKYAKRYHCCLAAKSVALSLMVYFVVVSPVAVFVHFSVLEPSIKALVVGVWAALAAFGAEWVRSNYWKIKMSEFYVEMSKDKRKRRLVGFRARPSPLERNES